MTTQELANRYVELFKQGNVPEIQNTFYDANVVCTEPEHAAARGIPTVTRGLTAVQEKAKSMRETIAELHSFYCTDPAVGGDYFSVGMGREFTLKNGQRIKGDEIAVFGVKDGKIVSETFFY
jgi:hypothetical protein